MFEEFGGGARVDKHWPQISYRDAALWYGTDKPDLRNPIRMQDCSEHFRGSGFAIFAKMLEQEGTQVRAIPAPGGGSRKFCDRMNAFAQKEGLPGMGYIFWREGDGAWTGPPARWPRTSAPNAPRRSASSLGLGVGDAAFFLGGKPGDFEAVAAKARDVIGAELGLTDRTASPLPGSSISRCTSATTKPARSTSPTTRSPCPRAGWRRWKATRSTCWATSTT